MLRYFKSPVAGGIAMGLGIIASWAIPYYFAVLTGTGLNGFAGCTVLMLVVAAVVAEYLARKRAA